MEVRGRRSGRIYGVLVFRRCGIKAWGPNGIHSTASDLAIYKYSVHYETLCYGRERDKTGRRAFYNTRTGMLLGRQAIKTNG